LQYFTQKTQEELFSLGEEKVKLEILTQINDELSMGNIESIFFEEYLFLE
jgi:flagellar basal body-associated protein FliL